MTDQAGYSGTPLPKKLGLKPGQRRLMIDMPASLAPVLGGNEGAAPFDYIHIFTASRSALEDALPRLKAQLQPAGMIWVSWPKKAAKVPTDITEDVIREVCLPLGLVDVKVCAVDAVWSGLKLVIRVSAR